MNKGESNPDGRVWVGGLVFEARTNLPMIFPIKILPHTKPYASVLGWYGITGRAATEWALTGSMRLE